MDAESTLLRFRSSGSVLLRVARHGQPTEGVRPWRPAQPRPSASLLTLPPARGNRDQCDSASTAASPFFPLAASFGAASFGLTNHQYVTAATMPIARTV